MPRPSVFNGLAGYLRRLAATYLQRLVVAREAWPRVACTPVAHRVFGICAGQPFQARLFHHPYAMYTRQNALPVAWHVVKA